MKTKKKINVVEFIGCILFVLGIFCLIGSVGACEMEQITIRNCVVRSVIFFVITICGGKLAHIFC